MAVRNIAVKLCMEDFEDLSAVDAEASAFRFKDRLASRLEARYDATVSISFTSSAVDEVEVDGSAHHREVEWIEDIIIEEWAEFKKIERS